jgi:uncharacterized protein YdiU (UPF0061 family)
VRLESSYLALPDRLYQQIRPMPVTAPRLFLWNAPLAAELGIPDALAEDRDRLARVFAGNELLPGSEPVALAYAGHQFGRFVPQLGDGRAHLLGEVATQEGLREIQLKGSGPTTFSRGGDGRSALGPAVRELIMSEALSALGVPTTRSLAVVTTGERVMRETPLPGGIVTRVAASHLRVGTFEYFAARKDTEALEQLVDLAIARHDPHLADAPERPLALLDAVIGRQVDLVVHWLRIGFIHGVMNTDNCALSGETIDYGPCAMMGVYDPETVYSSIDRQGRYAFGRQPAIVAWNMARFAEALLPLIDPDPKVAVEKATPLVEGISERFQTAWHRMMAQKLGLPSAPETDADLFTDLLEQMKAQQLDYTVTFDRLGASLDAEAPELRAQLGDWYDRWRAAIPDPAEARATMRRHNPVVIPRNHHVEAALAAAVTDGDPAPTERFLDVLRAPYELRPETPRYQDPPADLDAGYQTFCGT